MHARSNYKPAQASLGFGRKVGVRMMKKDGYQQQRLPDRESKGTDSDYNNLRGPPCHRLSEFANMKTDRSGSIEIEIDVVRRVKPPEPWNLVGEDVPEIKGVVE